MTDYHNEDKLKTLIKSIYSPAKASSLFKQQLCTRMLCEVEIQADGTRIFGLTKTVWVSIAAVIALGLIIYGVAAVPHPSVIINAAPAPPQSFLPEPLARVISFFT